MKPSRSALGVAIENVFGEAEGPTPRGVEDRARELGRALVASFPGQVESLSRRSGMEGRAPRSRPTSNTTLLLLVLVLGAASVVVGMGIAATSNDAETKESTADMLEEAPASPPLAKEQLAHDSAEREELSMLAGEILQLARGDAFAKDEAVKRFQALRVRAGRKNVDLVAKTEAKLLDLLGTAASEATPKAKTPAVPAPATPPTDEAPRAIIEFTAPPDSSAVDSSSQPDAEKPEPPRRLPVPAAAEREKAEKIVRELYADDFKRTKTDDLRELASRLLDQSRETQDDAAARYVLLRDAIDVATKADDTDRVVEAASELGTVFDVNGLTTKWTALAKVKAPKQPAAATLASALLDLSGEAADADDYEIALASSKSAIEHASRSGNATLLARAKARQEELLETKKAFDAVGPAKILLETNANDPDANLALGLFLCLNKRCWPKGLPLLAKGSNPGFQDAATKDLAPPKEDAERIQVGDAWWDLAETEKSKLRAAELRVRAVLWYEQALPNATGLTQLRLQKRIASVTPEAGVAQARPVNKPSAPSAPPPVRPRKVAARPLTLRLRNRWKLIGENRWEWEAFLDDSGTGGLDWVDHVVYVLHPTFPEPVRTVSERAGGFVLRTDGWGTFELQATAYGKAGGTVALRHFLVFSSNPPVGQSN